MSDHDEQITAVADWLYHPLLLAGERALSLSPIVDVSGPARGEVLWRRRTALAGFVVSTLHWHEIVPELRRSLDRIGLGESAQRAGIWVLTGRRYEQERDQWLPQQDAGQMFAYYQPKNGWRAMRHEPDGGRDGDWTEQWVRARPSGDEQAAIALIGHETGMLADVARVLRDQPAAYRTLEQILVQRAQRSVDQEDARRMGAMLRPREYLEVPMTQGPDPYPAGKLGTLCIPLFHALAGADNGPTGQGAAATARAAALCPPYKSVDDGFLHIVASYPAARVRPQAARSAPVRRGGRPGARSGSGRIPEL